MSDNIQLSDTVLYSTNNTHKKGMKYKMHIKAIHQKQKQIIKEKQNDVNSLSPHTIKKYRIAFNNFNKYLEQENIQTLNTNKAKTIIESYARHLKNNNYNQNTINQYLILIIKLLNDTLDTALNIKLKRVQRGQPRYIEPERYDIIINYLETQSQQAHTTKDKKIIETDLTIINLLYNTGLRIHEALKLTIKELENAEIDANNIHMLDIKGKGGTARTIFIMPSTYEILMQYIQQYSTPGQIYIFESDDKKLTSKGIHKQLTTRTIERHFKRIAKQLDTLYNYDKDDINNYTNQFKPHRLRASFAINSNDRLNIADVKELLGHQSIITTQIYTRPKREKIANDLAKAYL